LRVSNCQWGLDARAGEGVAIQEAESEQKLVSGTGRNHLLFRNGVVFRRQVSAEAYSGTAQNCLLFVRAFLLPS
jgi:hypothetical protein